jgi:hypothetical protein
MGDILELRPKVLEKLSIEFVDKWITDGEDAAAEWLHPKIGKHEYDRVRTLIHDEFLKRGYTFPEQHK